MAWEPPADQLERGQRAGEGVQRSTPRTELLDVPPMSAESRVVPAATSISPACAPRWTARAGRRYWRSLEELADTPEFHEFLHREFPQQASRVRPTRSDRREFLKLMGASLALAGLDGLHAAAAPRRSSRT